MESNSSNNLYISKTAQQSGYGTDRYKKVVFLTADERVRVKSGEMVFFTAARLSARGPAGTFWRVATVCGLAIGPRVPKTDEVMWLRTKTGVA
jgi:hypothetical protein